MEDHPPPKVSSGSLAWFLGITFALSWSTAAVIYFSNITYGSATSLALVATLYMWAPGIAAIAVAWRSDEKIRNQLGVFVGRLRWVAFAWLFPLILVALTIGVSAVLPGVAVTPDPATFLQQTGVTDAQASDMLAMLDSVPVPAYVLFAAQGIAAGLTINAIASLGEELGWRGFMLSALAPLGFWKVSLITGAIWGVWHAPLIAQGHNFPDRPIAGIVTMTVACIAMSPVLTYLTLRARTVLAAAFFHGTLNGVGSIALIYLATTEPLIASPVGLAGAAASVIALGGCVVHDRITSAGRIISSQPLTPWLSRR